MVWVADSYGESASKGDFASGMSPATDLTTHITSRDVSLYHFGFGLIARAISRASHNP